MRARDLGRTAVRTALAVLLGFLAGCLPGFHRDAPPELAELELCKAVPQLCKNRVYIFFLHGFGPIDACYLDKLRDEVIALGFIKTYAGWPHHNGYFENELCRLQQEEPHNRFVLVGQRMGASRALDLATAAQAAGVPIDLVLCIDGQHTGVDGPCPTARLIHVHSRGHSGGELAAAGEVHHVDAGAGKVCIHPVTMSVLSRELAEVAQRVPIVSVLPPPVPVPGITPRVLPAPLPAGAARDDWDFLKPDDNSAGAPGARPIEEAGAGLPATLQPR